MKILYIEDNPIDSELLLRYFSALSDQFTFTHAKTLAEARARLEESPWAMCDLVLTDFQLPDGTGLEFLHEIRSRQLPIAVVIITGQGDEQTAVIALKSGADDYIPKSFNYLESLPGILTNVHQRCLQGINLQKKRLRVLYAEHLTSDIDLTRRHLAANAPYIELFVVKDAVLVIRELQKTDREQWDVVLMDYQLPGMNAMEALREINHLGKHPPIIIVTGQGDEEVAAQALRHGAVDYIVKHPGYLHELAPSLENAYHWARLQKEHEALKESEERFRVAQETSPDGFTILHPLRNEKGEIVDFTWVYENQAIARINGTDPEEVKGKRMLDLFPTHIGTPIFDAYIHVADTGNPQVFEEVYVGEIVSIPTWLRIVVVPMEKDIAILAQDISDRKQTEEALLESEEKYKALFNQTAEGIYLHTKDGLISAVNNAACKQSGYSEDELLNSKVFNLRPHSSKKNLSDGEILTLWDQWQLGETHFFEPEHQRKDGSIYPVELSATKIQYGNQEFIMTIVRDITLRRDAEQAIRDYNERLQKDVELRTKELKAVHEQMIQQDRLANLGRLAGGMAHELRNPLGVISNAVYYLRMIQPDAGEKVKEYLGILEKESQAAVQIMSDLLNFSTFQTGDRYPIAVKSLIENVLKQFPPQSSIQVKVDIPASCPHVYVDSHQVELAIGRLVVNAYQAMEKGGRLKINVKSPSKGKGDWVTVMLEDTGIGISQEDMRQIFEPLFTTKPRHIGLGLSISKRLIEVNGGSIRLESKWGKGTAVTVTLPTKAEG